MEEEERKEVLSDVELDGDKSGTGRLALVERSVPINEVTIISDVAHRIL